jgi:hypothetical protein
MHKGYKCLNRATCHIYISRDVVFSESLFPFATPSTIPSSSPTTKPIVCHDQLRNYRVELMTTNVPLEGVSVSGSNGASLVPAVPACFQPHVAPSSSGVPEDLVAAQTWLDAPAPA